MKEVNLYVFESKKFDVENRPGGYQAVLEYMGHQKTIVDRFDRDTTPNRMIILGILNALKMLKVPCNIQVYVSTTIGMKAKNSPNKDLIVELKDFIEQNRHTVNFIVNPDLVRKVMKKHILYDN